MLVQSAETEAGYTTNTASGSGEPQVVRKQERCISYYTLGKPITTQQQKAYKLEIARCTNTNTNRKWRWAEGSYAKLTDETITAAQQPHYKQLLTILAATQLLQQSNARYRCNWNHYPGILNLKRK